MCGVQVRRARSQARTPRTPTVVPTASDTAMSTAWIQRNPLGAPRPTSRVDQARGSSQTAMANLGQMIQVQIPTPKRNAAQPRESTTVADAGQPARLVKAGNAVEDSRWP